MADDMRIPVLNNHPSNNGFTPLHTLYVIGFSICLMIFVEIVVLWNVFVGISTTVRCDLFYLLVYTEVSLWFINFIIRSYVKRKHKHCLIGKNFFACDEETIPFIEIPFYISCIWLAILVVILCLYAEYDVSHDFYCDVSQFYSPIIAITIIITIQNLLIIPLFVIYIRKMNTFNKSQGLLVPGNGFESMSSPLQVTLASADVGFRERCEAIDDMLEKQADLIRYYKEANEMLNKKIFQLTSQGRTEAF